jgi:hypothetical protein
MTMTTGMATLSDDASASERERRERLYYFAHHRRDRSRAERKDMRGVPRDSRRVGIILSSAAAGVFFSSVLMMQRQGR